MKQKVLVAMSGGVDSSAAAFLLKKQGYECVGCTMKLYNNEDAGITHTRTCCSLTDIEDARKVSYKLQMPYYVLNFTDDFKRQVIDKFVKSYEKGITPNPCIDCNRYMKFQKLHEMADNLGCAYIATGHYAKIEKINGQYYLKKAVDSSKDQSYVLYSMTQKQLSRTLFPLGNLCKSEIRDLARENTFTNADKPDSQDICFVPDGDYVKAIARHSKKQIKPGNFIDIDGNILGRHKGIVYYTIGQRRGLGISAKHPLYVCKISTKDNTVVLGRDEDLLRADAEIDDFNWIAGFPPSDKFLCKAKIRYNQKEQPAEVIVKKNIVRIIFDKPQRAVTPGQSAVLYDGDTVLGGGTIV